MPPTASPEKLETMKKELAEIVGVRPEDIIITQKPGGSIDVKVGRSTGPTNVYTVSEAADGTAET